MKIPSLVWSDVEVAFIYYLESKKVKFLVIFHLFNFNALVSLHSKQTHSLISSEGLTCMSR